MKRTVLLMTSVLLMSAAQADEAMGDAEKESFCARIRDFAVQALYDRDHGRPMKRFSEDGGAGAPIANHIIHHIYAEPQIRSPKTADAYSRATCNELAGVRGAGG